MWSFMADFFLLVWCFQGSSILCHLSELHSFLFLNNILQLIVPVVFSKISFSQSLFSVSLKGRREKIMKFQKRCTLSVYSDLLVESAQLVSSMENEIWRVTPDEFSSEEL
jgi:hypothetical protein